MRGKVIGKKKPNDAPLGYFQCFKTTRTQNTYFNKHQISQATDPKGKRIMSHNHKQSNNEKTVTGKNGRFLLTELSTAFNLKIALASPQANQRVSRQIKGGQADIQQPPHVRGFLMPVNLIGNDTSLPRGYGIEKRLRVNTCGGVPLSHLETRGSFQTASAKPQDNTKELTAMNANTNGTATPVAATQGASSKLSNDCLLPFSVLPDAINQASEEIAKAGKHGTGKAYAGIIKQLHAAIFPYLIKEASGNTAQIARWLGIHRDTVISYASSVGLCDQLGEGQGGAK